MNLEYGMDFRKPEYRREVFMRFYEFHLKYKAHPGGVYYAIPMLFDYVKALPEQKYWILFLNGCCQNIVTTFILFKHFPHCISTEPNKINDFVQKNWGKLQWDMDRRYAKAKIGEMVENYQQVTNKQQQLFFSNYNGEYVNPKVNFFNTWQVVINNFKYFGRLSTFSYLEYLKIGGLNIECDTLFLDDINGSKSHRNGICKVMGRDDLDCTKENPVKYTDELISQIIDWGKDLLSEAKERINHKDVNYFTLESTLCCYKSWFRKNRRYPNVYNDMFAERIQWSLDNFQDKEVEIFWKFREKTLPDNLRIELNSRDVGIKPDKQNHFRNTGEVIMMNQEWECFKNTYNDYTDKGVL